MYPSVSRSTVACCLLTVAGFLAASQYVREYSTAVLQRLPRKESAEVGSSGGTRVDVTEQESERRDHDSLNDGRIMGEKATGIASLGTAPVASTTTENRELMRCSMMPAGMM
jgi:hypothetical protein